MDWYFDEGMETNGAGKKVKKERNVELSTKDPSVGKRKNTC